MKKFVFLCGVTAIGVLFFTNCQTKQDSYLLSPEYLYAQNNLNINYTQARSFNDSVTVFHMHDSTMESGMCSYYDSLYHYHDSLFTVNYNHCMQLLNNGNMMSGNVGMMCANSRYMYDQQKIKLELMLDQMNAIRQLHIKYHFK